MSCSILYNESNWWRSSLNVCGCAWWVLTVVLKLDHELVDDLNPARTFREADAVAGRREPLADGFQSAVVVVTCHVVQHRRVIYKRIQFAVHRQRKHIACTNQERRCLAGTDGIRDSDVTTLASVIPSCEYSCRSDEFYGEERKPASSKFNFKYHTAPPKRKLKAVIFWLSNHQYRINEFNESKKSSGRLILPLLKKTENNRAYVLTYT